MKQLLTALGARPDQIAKVLATAEANRKKPPTASTGGGMMAAMMGGGGMPGGMGGMQGGGMPGGGMPGGMPSGGAMMGAPAGGEGGGQRGAGGGGMFGGANMTPEQQQKVRAAMQKALNGKSMQELTPEERTGIMTKVREEVAKLGITMPQRGAGAGGGGRGGAGGPGGAPGGMMMPFAGGNGPFSAKDMEMAKLPPPPEEDSQVEVLLRPGLLADVEIIIEKIENAVNVPMQAVFEKDGKQVVYVKNGNKFDERVIRPSKRSESTMVIAEGVKPGETVALADPNEKPGDKKKKSDQKPAGGGAAGMPMPKS
jgi:hypothetical protein